MLTHNDIHILAAYLFTASKPGSLDIVLGNMVADVSIGEARDVDVTFRDPKSQNLQFLTGVEVKDERRPLDVALVEQLATKMNDMPLLEDKFIISASGYSKRAVKKANAKGVRLLDLIDFDPTKHLDENWPGLASYILKDEYFQWIPEVEAQVNLDAPDQTMVQRAPLSPETPLFIADGQPHPSGRYVKTLIERLQCKAGDEFRQRLEAQGKFPLEDGARVKADVLIRLTDNSFVQLEDRHLRISSVHFRGTLEMINREIRGDVKVLIHHGSTQPFVGGAVAVSTNGRMFAVSCSPETQRIGVALISPETRQGVIRNRRLANS